MLPEILLGFFTVFPVWPLALSRSAFTQTFTEKKKSTNEQMNGLLGLISRHSVLKFNDSD